MRRSLFLAFAVSAGCGGVVDPYGTTPDDDSEAGATRDVLVTPTPAVRGSGLLWRAAA
jgi:hypothetical protein